MIIMFFLFTLYHLRIAGLSLKPIDLEVLRVVLRVLEYIRGISQVKWIDEGCILHVSDRMLRRVFLGILGCNGCVHLLDGKRGLHFLLVCQSHT
jgi:hypothetical protein